MKRQCIIESTIGITDPIGSGSTRATIDNKLIGEIFIDVIPTGAKTLEYCKQHSPQLARFYNDVITRYIDPPKYAILIRQAVININYRGIGLLQEMIRQSIAECHSKDLDPLVAITPGAINKAEYRGDRDMLVQIPGPEYVSEEALRHHYERIGFLSLPDAVEMVAKPEYFLTAPAIPIRHSF